MSHTHTCPLCGRTVKCSNESCPDDGWPCPKCQELSDDGLIDDGEMVEIRGEVPVVRLDSADWDREIRRETAANTKQKHGRSAHE